MRVRGLSAPRREALVTPPVANPTRKEVRLSEPRQYEYPKTVQLQAAAQSPIPPRDSSRVLTFSIASERVMAGLFGSIRLEINADSVDMSRLEVGLLSFVGDHDTTALIGRMVEMTIQGTPPLLYGAAELSKSARADRYLAEIDDGVRSGVSPGFIILETEAIKKNDPDYDGEFSFSVTRWEPYEISSTPIPRNQDARILGRMSMDAKRTDPPAIIRGHDIHSMSLGLARAVLRKGGGSPEQREKLGLFVRTYQAALEQGTSLDEAAARAQESIGR